MCVLLITWLLREVGRVGVLSVDTPTNCPKSVRNLCIIELFEGVLCCTFAFLSVGIWAFVTLQFKVLLQ